MEGISLIDQLSDCRYERIEIVLDDISDERNVDAEVLVRQDVSGTRDSAPGNVWPSGREGLGAEVSNYLTHDFEISDHRVLGLAVTNKLLAPVSRVFAYPLQTVSKMSEEYLSVLHSGRASARMRSRR